MFKKLLFTFFESNIEAIVNQNSLQLFTYETDDYLATIYFRTDHNFQKQLLTGGSNSSQCTQKIFICLQSLAYAILSIIKFRRLKLPSLEELGTKRTNFRWNLDIPTSKLALNRDLRNIPLKENVFTRTFQFGQQQYYRCL